MYKHIVICRHTTIIGPVGRGCRIHQLLLCRGVRPPPTSVQDMILNDLMVKFQKCTPSLPSLPGPLWPGVIAPDRLLSIHQFKLNSVLMLN